MNEEKIQNKISVVTPTLGRPNEVLGLLENLSKQSFLPYEVILVDGAPAMNRKTEEIVVKTSASLPFRCHYLRQGDGTAIQRNAGIEVASGDFIAFIDDDIRLEPDFFEIILTEFNKDIAHNIGGIAGYITNQHLDPDTSRRWRWYRRLHLFTTYEPGHYDYQTGYPINRYLQRPHNGIREIDFMGANCCVWRREVFDKGLRFSNFFTDYGVVEDAHFSLRARKSWILLECGRAHCIHLQSPIARIDKRKLARKTAVNYRYLFIDIVPKRTLRQEFRFWLVQFFDLLRFILYALRYGGKENWLSVFGKLEGITAAWFIRINDY